MKKISAIALAFIFLFSNNINLYSSNIAGIDAVIKEAEENNPEILAAKKRWEASLARVPQMKSLDNPAVGFSSQDKVLSVSQAFPFIGKLSLKGKIAVAESQMAAGYYQNKRLEVINKAENAYYDLWMNYKEIALKEESLNLLESIFKIAEAKYITGEIRQEELFNLNIEITDLKNNVMNLRKEQSAKNTRINALLNRGA